MREFSIEELREMGFENEEQYKKCQMWDGWDYDIYYGGTVQCWEDLNVEQQALEKLTDGYWYQYEQLKQRQQKENPHVDFNDWLDGYHSWIKRGLDEKDYDWYEEQDLQYEEDYIEL